MNQQFKSNLKTVLCGGGAHQPDTAKFGEDKHGRDTVFLDKYAKERWEAVLYYMTGSTANEGGKHLLFCLLSFLQWLTINSNSPFSVVL